MNEQIISQIVAGDINVLYNLLQTEKDNSKELHKAYNLLKYGKTIKYHIKWFIEGLFEIRDRTGEVLFQNTIYKLEDWWDEEEERAAYARKVLLEYYDNDTPYEGR